jgi:hypothetical protein
MTHDELLKYINDKMAPWDKMFNIADYDDFPEYTRKQAAEGMMPWVALYQVVELHKQVFAIVDDVNSPSYCQICSNERGYTRYPCPTIQVIETTIDGLD